MARQKFPSDKQDQFMLRLPEGLRDRIKAYADKKGRSMNAQIVQVLQTHFPEPFSLEKRIDELLDLTAAAREGSALPEVEKLVEKLEELVEGMGTGQAKGLDQDTQDRIRERLWEFKSAQNDDYSDRFYADLSEDEIAAIQRGEDPFKEG